jgi:hypothetical protein
MLFGVDGCIAWGRHNFCGSWNDGETSREFQYRLMNEEKNLPGHGVLSDSAFPVGKHLVGRIMTPPKDGELDRVTNCR